MRHRIANTYLATATAYDICFKLEADLGFKWDKKTDEPVGKSKVKSVDPVEDWSDNWIDNNGGLNGAGMDGQQ